MVMHRLTRSVVRILVVVLLGGMAFGVDRVRRMVEVMNRTGSAPPLGAAPPMVPTALTPAPGEPLDANLSDVYRPASAATLQVVTGRWQIVEQWDDGICFYSWRRELREKRGDKRSLTIFENEMMETRQHPWEERESPVYGTTILKIPPNLVKERRSLLKRTVVFDTEGPMTFQSLIANDDERGGFETWTKTTFPYLYRHGQCERGVAELHDEFLDLYWVTISKEGRARSFPRTVSYPPDGVGVSLLRLRRYPHDWSYPPPNLDLDRLREHHEASLSKTANPRDIPLGSEMEFHSVDEMPAEIREAYERSIREMVP